MQIASISNKIRGSTTTDFKDIKRITDYYYEQLYKHKLDNLDKVDHFSEKNNLSQFT